MGNPAAGKDVAADYIAKQGFVHISSGNIIREIMSGQDIPTDRTHTHAFVKSMRMEYGNHFPAGEIVRRATARQGTENKETNIIVSGLRNLSAVDHLHKHFGRNFLLVAIDAPLEMRYARVLARERPGDVTTFEQFKEEQDRERNDGTGAHEMDKVIAAADVTIENVGTEAELFAKLDEMLAELTHQTQ